MPDRDAVPELRDHLSVLWRRKASICVVVAVIVGTAMLYSFQQTKIYRSSSEVVVKAANLSPTEQATGFVDMETERRVANSVQVAEIARPELEKAGISPASLSVQTDGKAQALTFTASSPSPAVAQQTAQAYSEAYLGFRRDQVLEDLRAASDPLKQRIDELNAQIEEVQRGISAAPAEAEQTALQIRFNSLFTQRTFLEQKLNELILPEKLQVGRITRPAGLPTSPSSPDHMRTATFALFLALSIGVGQAFIRDRLDDRPRDRSDLAAAAGVPVLAVIPRFQGRRSADHVETLEHPLSPAAEGYRRLRTNLLHAMAAEGAKTVLITSADVAEGKTTTTVNLAVALALAGSRVIVVGADLRHPDLRALIGDDSQYAGLVGVLEGKLALERAVVPTPVEGLHVLPAGRLTDNFGELLGSEATAGTLATLRSVADVVLLDGPPVLRLADALSLAPLVDGVVLVTDARRTTRRGVREATYQLQVVDARVLGAILNNHTAAWEGSYASWYGEVPPNGPRGPRETPAEEAPPTRVVEGVTALRAREPR